jgi:hypothetical protein
MKEKLKIKNKKEKTENWIPASAGMTVIKKYLSSIMGAV